MRLQQTVHCAHKSNGTGATSALGLRLVFAVALLAAMQPAAPARADLIPPWQSRVDCYVRLSNMNQFRNYVFFAFDGEQYRLMRRDTVHCAQHNMRFYALQRRFFKPRAKSSLAELNSYIQGCNPIQSQQYVPLNPLINLASAGPRRRVTARTLKIASLNEALFSLQAVTDTLRYEDGTAKETLLFLGTGEPYVARPKNYLRIENLDQFQDYVFVVWNHSGHEVIEAGKTYDYGSISAFQKRGFDERKIKPPYVITDARIGRITYNHTPVLDNPTPVFNKGDPYELNAMTRILYGLRIVREQGHMSCREGTVVVAYEDGSVKQFVPDTQSGILPSWMESRYRTFQVENASDFPDRVFVVYYGPGHPPVIITAKDELALGAVYAFRKSDFEAQRGESLVGSGIGHLSSPAKRDLLSISCPRETVQILAFPDQSTAAEPFERSIFRLEQTSDHFVCRQIKALIGVGWNLKEKAYDGPLVPIAFGVEARTRSVRPNWFGILWFAVLPFVAMLVIAIVLVRRGSPRSASTGIPPPHQSAGNPNLPPSTPGA